MSVDMEMAEKAVRQLLEAVGENPDRDGLRATPQRVARAWREMLAGYEQDPREALKTSSGSTGFDAVYDGMVVLAGFPFHSTCEHHLLPFIGVADVGYLPALGGKVVGLSKLGRLVEVYTRRLQMQERITAQVAQALQDHTQARGVGVRLRSTHLCMECRGVRRSGIMATETLLGVFREHALRAEFWSLADAGRR